MLYANVPQEEKDQYGILGLNEIAGSVWDGQVALIEKLLEDNGFFAWVIPDAAGRYQARILTNCDREAAERLLQDQNQLMLSGIMMRDAKQSWWKDLVSSSIAREWFLNSPSA